MPEWRSRLIPRPGALDALVIRMTLASRSAPRVGDESGTRSARSKSLLQVWRMSVARIPTLPYPAAIITTPEMASAIPAPCQRRMRSPSRATPRAIVTRG